MKDPSPPLLRTRRGLMFTALPAIAVLAVLGGLLAVRHHDSVAADRRAEMRNLARAAAMNARRFVDDRLSVLGTAVAAPSLRRGDLRTIREYLPSVQAAGQFTSGVAFVDRDLQVRASSRETAERVPSSLRGRAYARTALRLNRPVVSDVLIGLEAPRPILVFAYPIDHGDGRPRGVLTGGIRLDRLDETIERLRYAPDAGEILIDGAGHLIVGPELVQELEPAPARLDAGALRRRGDGVLTDLDLPDGRRIAGFSTVEGLPWLLVVERPYGDVIGPLDTALAAEVFALVALAFLGVLVTFDAGRRIDRLDAERDAALTEQRTIAVRLQRSLLPDVHSLERVQVHAGYTPAEGAMSVGGDWYDVVELEDGRLALSVGDVAGHGLSAAAAMGQLRSAVRTLALGRHEPADAIARLNDFARTLDGRPLATVVFAVLDPDTGRVRYACAGHPPPLVVRADGSAAFLHDGRSPLLGVDFDEPRPTGGVTLRAGDTFVCYTDGLVERPDRSIDEGLAELAEAASRASAGDTAALSAALLDAVRKPRRDDAAVLCLRLVPAAQPSSVAS